MEPLTLIGIGAIYSYWKKAHPKAPAAAQIPSTTTATAQAAAYVLPKSNLPTYVNYTQAANDWMVHADIANATGDIRNFPTAQNLMANLFTLTGLNPAVWAVTGFAGSVASVLESVMTAFKDELGALPEFFTDILNSIPIIGLGTAALKEVDKIASTMNKFGITSQQNIANQASAQAAATAAGQGQAGMISGPVAPTIAQAISNPMQYFLPGYSYVVPGTGGATVSASSPEGLANAAQAAVAAYMTASAGMAAEYATALSQGSTFTSAGPNPNILRPVPPTQYAKELAQKFRNQLVTDAPVVSDVGPISIFGISHGMLSDAPPLTATDIKTWGEGVKRDLDLIAGTSGFYEQSPYARIREEISGSQLWFNFLRGQADYADVEFLIGVYRKYPYNVTVPAGLIDSMKADIDQYVAAWPQVRVALQQAQDNATSAREDWDARAWALVYSSLGNDPAVLKPLADVSFGNPYGAISYLAMKNGAFSQAGFLQYEFDVKFNQYYHGEERQHIIDPFYNGIKAGVAAADLVDMAQGDTAVFNAFKQAYEATSGFHYGVTVQSHEGPLDPVAEYQKYIGPRKAAAQAAAWAAMSANAQALFRQSEAQRIYNLLKNTILPQGGFAVSGGGSPGGWTESVIGPLPAGSTLPALWNELAHSIYDGAFDGYAQAYAQAQAMLSAFNGLEGTRFV